MTETAGLLALLQIGDSLFPSGMFTHSLGLEQLVREGRVAKAEGVERFTASVIESSVATSDAIACARAVHPAEVGDITHLIDLDYELLAMKPAAELREATLMAGKRLLDEVVAHEGDRTIARWRDEVHAGRTPGTHAVAFGVVAVAYGIGAENASAALMQGAASAILQAGMRLFPVSHRDVQGALHRLRPRIAELAAAAAEPGREMTSFAPLQEIAAMRHEGAAVRMFAS